MAYSSAARELRRNILKLASLPTEDSDAIIQCLDDEQRKTVLDMLADLEGKRNTDTQQVPASLLEPVLLPTDLSPWLVARVNGQSDYGEETADRFTIAPHAQRVLRRCAAAMVPQPPAKKAPPSLLERLWQGLAR